ncbi:MAG: hypothetical protein ACRCSC_01865, partial [Lactococcus garvieae]
YAEWERTQQQLANEELANTVADKVAGKYRGTVSNTTINYYNETINPTGGENVKLPIPPQSKLKPIAQTPHTYGYQDQKQPVITVEHSINNRLFGGLLHEPVSGAEITVAKFDTGSVDGSVAKASSNALQNLNQWAAGREQLSTDSMSIVFLDKVSAQNGTIEQVPVYGTEAISMLYASFYGRSLNTGVPAITAVPKRISTVSKKAINGNVSTSSFGFGFAPRQESFEHIELPAALAQKGAKGSVTIKSVAEAFYFLFGMLDLAVGEFPVSIEIEDTALGLNGNQSAKISIPNIAEGIAELFGLVFNNNQHAQLNTIINTKGLVVATQNLISSNVTQDVALATADYMGFKNAEIKRKIKLPIDPTKEEIADLLKDSEQEYKTYDFQDEKNLQHDLVRFNDVAGIIKASLYKRFDPNNLEEEVKNYLNTLKGENLGGKDDKWREFLNAVENGFSDAKLENKTEPYGEAYDRRPLIRDLTHDTNV